MNFLSVLFFLCIFVYDCTSFRNRNDHLCSVLENTHKSYYNNQYHFCRKWNRRRNNKSRLETSSSSRGGKNGAASNDGILIKWEKVSGEQITDNCCWHPSSDINPGWGRRKRSVHVRGPGGGCCPLVRVSASGAAARVQWDRLGLYRASGDIHNGRPGHTLTAWQSSVRMCAMHYAESRWQCCWP